MHIKLYLSLILIAVTAWPAGYVAADADLSVKSQIELDFTPTDMKLSRDGRWLYLLTQDGKLLVYSYEGRRVGAFVVGPQYTQIEAGPNETEIYVLDKTGKQLLIAELNYERDIDISGSPFKGAADAPVTIVEYTDFQCPYCAKLSKMFKELLARYPGKIKIVYKSYPLSSHKFAWKAAAAAMAAHEKGQFWPFYDRLFDNYDKLDNNKLMEIRKAFGFGEPDFAKLMKSTTVRTKVAKDKKEGQAIGVRGTPTVFINGKLLKNKSLDGFKAAIERELAQPGQ